MKKHKDRDWLNRKYIGSKFMRVEIKDEWLREKYIKEKLGAYRIAKICGYSPTTIHNYLKKFGIPLRNRSEAIIHNLQNKWFGRLVVRKDTGRRYRGNIIWLAECTCGKLIEVRGAHLISGGVKSCGCLGRQKSRERFFKHGESNKNSRLYRIWCGMKQRCYNPKSPSYKNHGGKGITVYSDWKNDFTAFRDWALNNGYTDNLIMVRTDKNGNFEPHNIQFLTKQEAYS